MEAATPVNLVADLDKAVTPRTLPYLGGTPWQVSVGASAVAVTKGRPTPPLDIRVTDRADYYLWCGANICVHQPPEAYKGQVTNYFAAITPSVQGAFRHPPVVTPVDRWLELVRWAPTTTQGATAYESGMSESVNGSIGFFGDAPTASVGAGVTWNNSQNRTTPDVDIAAYTRSDSATFMFNLNQPSTISATSSMEIYVQALFRLEGFSPEYLAYLDYTQGKASNSTASIDPTTGLPPLKAQDFQNWKTFPAANQANLLSQRAFQYTNAITLEFNIDFQAITQTNVLPMAPVTISCGTPSVDTGQDVWLEYLGSPDPVTLLASPAVGQASTVIGYLICNDPNYMSGSVDRNPNTMFDYQTLQSWNGEYNLTMDPSSGALSIATSYSYQGSTVWSEQVPGGDAWFIPPPPPPPPNPTNKTSPPAAVKVAANENVRSKPDTEATPSPTTPSKTDANLKSANATTTSAPPPTPTQTEAAPAVVESNANPPTTTSLTTVVTPSITILTPFKLQLNETSYTISVATNQGNPSREFDFASQSPPAANAVTPDKYPYRRLELTGAGILRLVDSSYNILWATKYIPPSTGTTTISGGIFSSLGGAVNGLEAIGGGVLQLGESALGIGSIIPGISGGIGNIPGLSSVIGNIGGGLQTGAQVGENIANTIAGGFESVFSNFTAKMAATEKAATPAAAATAPLPT